MSRKAVVFFSHSSDDNPRAQALCAAIEATGQVRTTIDLRDLRQAKPWAEQLDRWMARCDAGFLMLTPAVMARPGWVLREATTLRARQVYAGARFPLFVLVEPAARAHPDWARLFEPLGLLELQATAGASSDAAIAAAVVQACEEAAALEADDYLSRLRDQLASALAPFAADLPFANGLLNKLAVADEHWHAIVGGDTVLADTLAQRLCEAHASGAIGEYAGLDALMQAFRRKRGVEERCQVLLALRPYWVNLGAAMKLAAVMRNAPGQRLCVLATSLPADAPELHIDRFLGPYNALPTVLHAVAGNESASDLLAQTFAAWNERFPGLPVSQAAQLNARLAKSAVPVVVILPPLAVAQPARDLAAAVPLATFVVPVLPDGADLQSADWAGITVLEPSRDAEQEDTFQQHYYFAQTFAEQR